MNIIFETQFGSHIYGTNTEKSDIDYKGIYKADYKDIVLDMTRESIVSTTKKNKGEGVRNKAGDVDREYKELRRFINDAISGQTYALDMLFTPPKWWIEKSPEWYYLSKNRKRFLSKQMNAFIGYIRQQTGKYAMKGTRMASVLSTVEYLKKQDPKYLLHEVWDDLSKDDYTFIKDHDMQVNKIRTSQPMLNVLEKIFQANVKVKFVLDTLQKFYDEFGTRSVMAMNNQGVDWKAISHAYRACYQLMDIAKSGEIIFPLKQAEYVLEIKTGNISYKDVVQDELPKLMNVAMDLINESSLPEKVDRTFWDGFIVKNYEAKTV